jgi:hypothetical protein
MSITKTYALSLVAFALIMQSASSCRPQSAPDTSSVKDFTEAQYYGMARTQGIYDCTEMYVLNPGKTLRIEIDKQNKAHLLFDAKKPTEKLIELRNEDAVEGEEVFNSDCHGRQEFCWGFSLPDGTFLSLRDGIGHPTAFHTVSKVVQRSPFDFSRSGGDLTTKTTVLTKYQCTRKWDPRYDREAAYVPRSTW